MKNPKILKYTCILFLIVRWYYHYVMQLGYDDELGFELGTFAVPRGYRRRFKPFKCIAFRWSKQFSK